MIDNCLTMQQLYKMAQEWKAWHNKQPSKIKLSRHHIDELLMGLPDVLLIDHPINKPNKQKLFGIDVDIDETNMTIVEFIE
jgi:hypothetical protein